MSPLAWSFVLSVIGIAGIILAGSKYKLGWLIGFFVQPLWIIFAVTTEQYGFILNAIIYAAVYARNWLRWRAEERELAALADFVGRPGPVRHRGRRGPIFRRSVLRFGSWRGHQKPGRHAISSSASG